MKRILFFPFLVSALTFYGCGVSPRDDVVKGDSSNPVFTNNSTVNTVNGVFRTTARHAGTYVSSLPNASVFTTKTSKGTFTTTSQLVLADGTVVYHYTVTDLASGLVVGQTLKSGSVSVLVVGDPTWIVRP